MDDSCAVCAESLEWVAYGPCGHKDVCSTCVARLRFICDDRRCCICKSESDVVFITKALGDYTTMINDFSVFPVEAKVGRYWYHEDTQGYFDDLDHYRMIKAMCKLSCAACDKMEDLQQGDGSRRSRKFWNIGQLKRHLFHQHKLHMCSLCLEGRKVFICEQKLYTRAQLNQHISTGDSKVDGTESERGGFMGHPMCQFCTTPFYGENELYTHMSTEHYTCHICQRQHPGQYEYYKNYDDLETHFRQGHFLCEDESCLAKKFLVFQSEAEMKRHNTLEHGGHMSRSQRSAALQIPTSFQYRRSNEQDNRRGRGRGRTFLRDRADAELSMATEASLDTSNADRFPDASSGSTQVTPDSGDASDSIVQPFDSLATTDSKPPTRYLQALSQRSRITLQESSFPPLVTAPETSQQKTTHDPEGLPKNTMVERLRQLKNKNVSTPASNQAWPAPMGNNNKPTGAFTSTQEWPASMSNNKPIDALSSSQAWPAAGRGPLTSDSTKHYTKASTNVVPGSSSNLSRNKPAITNGSATSSYASLAQGQPSVLNEPSSSSSSSSRGGSGSSRIIHSSSAPNLVEVGSLKSDFPPVSAIKKQPVNVQAVLNVEDVQTANKSLVERIHAGLSFDQGKYIDFKKISGEFRQGLTDASTYLMHVQQFGLTHLVLELAKLCPDAEKQRDLVDTFYANFSTSYVQENGGMGSKQSNGDKKGKGKSIGASNISSKDKLADDVISTVRKLQSNYKTPSEDEVEILSKDGYRAAKGKLTVIIDEPRALARTSDQPMLKVKNSSQFVDGRYNLNSGIGNGENKQKKTSKFHRVRLGMAQ